MVGAANAAEVTSMIAARRRHLRRGDITGLQDGIIWQVREKNADRS